MFVSHDNDVLFVQESKKSRPAYGALKMWQGHLDLISHIGYNYSL